MEHLEMTDAVVKVLASVAHLQLPKDREEGLISLAQDWLNGANELSRKMSNLKYLTLTPVTAFVHQGAVGSEGGMEK